MKKVTKINYVKVMVLAVVTVFLVAVLTNFYNNKRNYERANDDVMGFLSVIRYDELNEYLVENTDGFIYISSSADTTLDSFELVFKNYILEEDLDKDIIYLDSNSFSVNIYDDLKNKYFSESLSKQIEIGRATLFAIKDSQIIAILNVNYEDNDLFDIKEFISNYGVTE